MQRRFTRLYTLLCATFLFHLSDGQVVINEVSSSNFQNYADNDGDYEDWVELYNPGPGAVNLANWTLSDDPLAPAKWTFPSVSMPANSYLTVFASGKDKIDFIDHYETIVYENDTWRYLVPASGVPSTWKDLTFNDAAWATGTGGIGYGDGDDGTNIGGPDPSVYSRRTFNIIDSAAIRELYLHADYDDGFIAYLNGTEIARANMSGTNPPYNQTADGEHEAQIYQGGNPDEIVIDPVIWEPLLRDGNNVLAIQVHNATLASSDLSGRFWLSAGIGDASSNYGPIPGFFTPPVSTTYLHTNFGINNNGEDVVLSDNTMTLIDQVTVPELDLDLTYGRFPNGSGTWEILDPATPNANNGTATPVNGFWDDTVSFSLPGGFYFGAQNVACSCNDGLSTVRYTTDGTKPTAASTAYTGPIAVSTNTVIRAGCFRAGYITRYTGTNSYLFNTHTLPVVSLSFNPDDFFDFNTGIYELGPGASGTAPNYGANFWQDWEREVHMEYYDASQVFQFEQDLGAKIFGGWSRDEAMKSLRLIPRDQYGPKKINYPLFSEKPLIDKYDQIVLRNSGNDFNMTHYRDALNHVNLEYDTYIDKMAYQPVVVYFNGEYWGIHNMRERINPEYVEANHGHTHQEVDFLEFDGGAGDVKQGTNVEWQNLLDFIANNDMAIQANFDWVTNYLDHYNVADYFAVETYHNNWDWPHNNIRYWRHQPSGSGFRYIYYDTDFAFGLFGFSNVNTDELDRAINATDNVHSPMFKKLLDNLEYRCYFVDRYADLINTNLQPAHYLQHSAQIKATLQPEMAMHWAEWGNSQAGWDSEIAAIENFINNRPGPARDDIESQFALSGQVDVTIQVDPPGSGVIKISTIIPDNLPWTGVYFDGCPVTMVAIPNAGYSFDHWEAGGTFGGNNFNDTITYNIGSDDTFTAFFNSAPNNGLLTISEINYHSPGSLDAGDWVEFLNYGTDPINISGWEFRDGNDFNSFVFPPNTIIPAGGYLVLIDNEVKFNAAHPTVTNYVGEFNFNLSNGGELLRLFNTIGELQLSVTYDDEAPWPVLPDGNGSTLEQVDSTMAIDTYTNWFPGCFGGSPGTYYTPCPCADVDLGPDRILCAEGGSYLINPGIATHPDRTFTWFINGSELIGYNLPFLNASSAGTYELRVDTIGCFNSDQVNIQANLSGLGIDLQDNVELCSPITYDYYVGPAVNGVTYTWEKDGQVINNLPTPGTSLTVNTPGTYEIIVSASGCSDFTDQSVVTSLAAIPDNDSICSPATASLAVSGPSSNYEWYTAPTGGSPINTGNTYTTPSLTGTTTYYVEDGDFFSGTVGPVDPDVLGDLGGAIWTNSDWDGGNNYKLIFDVQQPLYLNAVTVYADGPQDVTVRILDTDMSTVLFSRTVTITSAGQNRIPLGFNFTSTHTGIYMDMVGTTGELQMNGNGGPDMFTWNSSTPGYMRITDTEPAWAEGQGWYFYAYNWEYASGPGACERVPVVAYDNCDPGLPVELVNFNAVLNHGITELTWNTANEKNASHFTVERSVDGANFTSLGTVSAQGNSSQLISYVFHDYSPANGINYYRLKQVDLDGAFEYSDIKSVHNRATVGSIKVQPNPNEGAFDLSLYSFENGEYTLDIVNAQGEKVYTKVINVEGGVEKTSIFLDVPKGVYLYRIFSSEQTRTGKIVIY